MLQTRTDGKNTSDRGTLPSSVVCTVEFQNSVVLLYRNSAPDITEASTMSSQKVKRNVRRPRRISLFSLRDALFPFCFLLAFDAGERQRDGPPSAPPPPPSLPLQEESA